MIEIGIDPILVRLGPLVLSWHSLFSMVGIAVGVWLMAHLARGKGLLEDKIYPIAVWAVAGGIIGARLIHVVDYWDVYMANPAAILAIWEGGLAIWGGILGGTLSALIYGKLSGTAVAPFADPAALGLILAQAIGRIGDIINGEHLSLATNLPWGIIYTHPGSPAYGLPPSHPAVAYELIMDLVIFGALWMLRDRIRREGNLFLIYLISYSTGRFLLSFLRLDSNTVFLSLNQAQWISLLVLAVSLPLLVVKSVRHEHHG
ncbi:MAG: prolipoprotein diacylglyceryl transferase [Chloroflexi bacterium]|nr:prolipoprotein diacylglyceryl transferase [Chloroflexota bacterium]